MFLLSGCAALEGEDFAAFDPYEGVNRKSYVFTDSIDRAALQPVAKGYQHVMPDVVETGVLNVFNNLRTVDSTINGFLQAKPKAGFIDLSRLLINTTLGVAGIFDVASRWGLYDQNEDFGQTLAVWGMRKSRYVFVPFLGPTTIRDMPTTILRSFLPSLLLGSAYHWSISGLDIVSARASLLGASQVRDASALDPYAFTRDAYFQRRKFLIYDSRPPLDDLFDAFDEEFDEEFDDEFDKEALDVH